MHNTIDFLLEHANVYVTLVLSTKILERVMLLKRFASVFRQCKQSLDNKELQLSSRNNKSKLKIN